MTEIANEREAIALFEALLDIAEADRDTWLDQRTRGNSELRARIEAMRRADRNAALRTGAATVEATEEPAPERIGVYRIVGLIGRGGMGSVYRGEREAGDFDHIAAIKLVKPGLLSSSLTDRLRKERQTLAQMQHPNIAQLYDGGETPEGLPYIVMEYVDGQPLLAWAESRALNADARAALFITICDAVAFAHRNLVVHRDLTPSNILVTADGTVKLIDFGIAKPVDTDDEADGAAISSPMASLASLSLTPGFAAPERLTSLRVTTAADIYSLGKILASLIRERDADVSAIIERATASDIEDRYPTADALRDDVEAWMTGMPVDARRGGWRYRLSRFVARHRVGSLLGGTAVILVVGALIMATVGYTRAERARKAEAERFEEVRDLAGFMIFDLEKRLSRVAGNAEARVALTKRAQAYLSNLAATSVASPELRMEAALGFLELARVRGIPGQPNQGDREGARQNLVDALKLIKPLAGVDATSLRASVLANRALLEAHADTNLEKAERSITTATGLLGPVVRSRRNAQWYQARSEVRRSQLELALLNGDADALRELATKLAHEANDQNKSPDGGYRALLDRALSEHYLGLSGYLADTLDRAVSHFVEADRRLAALEAKEPNEPYLLYIRAFNAYTGHGTAVDLPAHRSQAANFLQTANVSVDRLLAIEPNDAAMRSFAAAVKQAEAQDLSARGLGVQAIGAQRQVIENYEVANLRKQSGGTTNKLVGAYQTLALIADNAGQKGQACQARQSAISLIALLRKRNELLGSVEALEPDIRRKATTC